MGAPASRHSFQDPRAYGVPVSLPATISGQTRFTRHSCRWCPVTFMGPGAQQRWADHTWSHWDELVASGVLTPTELGEKP